MRAFLGIILACATAWLAAPAAAQDAPRYVVLVTIDGYRWQELFHGADPALVTDLAYRARYVDVPDRAQALTPFVLSFAQSGALIGDRDHGSCAHVTNAFWFSYPGYAEILEGHPNPHIRRNHAGPNPEVTVLERLIQRPEFSDQTRVYAEWGVARDILNVERSHIPTFVPPDVNAPHDPQVMAQAREIFGNLPRITWLALGDTDNRAHEGKYEAYLDAAHDADQYIHALWDAIETDPRTAGHTTMIVTADHGRGPSEGGGWRGHGSGRWRGVIVPGLRKEGSDQVFIAARGPGIVATDAYDMDHCATSSQVAATLLESLGLLDQAQPDMGAPLAIFGERALSAQQRLLVGFYVLVAFAALCATWGQNLQLMTLGMGPLDPYTVFAEQVRVNPASRSITVDIGFFLLAAVVFMVIEARRLGVRFVWLYVLAAFLIAISTAFPLFMAAREIRIARRPDIPAAWRLTASDLAGLAIVAAAVLALAWRILS